MQFETLYSKDSKGGLRIWEISTVGANIVVRHGQVAGKIVEKVTTSKPKNEGKSNATTAEEQAISEAKAKWVKQCKSGYFTSKEEALAFEEFTPMKAQNYKDHASKVSYPTYMQPKLNGQRLMVDHKVQAWSKQGEPISYPEHWIKEIEFLKEHLPIVMEHGLDGEVYAGLESEGGLSLQKIISAFRKPNADTPSLKYYVYDIPAKGKSFDHRVTLLLELRNFVSKHAIRNIVVVVPDVVKDEAEGDLVYKGYVHKKYEGGVYRNFKGQYEFGKRSYDLIKRKPRQTAECYVYGSEQDRNNEAVLYVELENGVKFKLKMLKEAVEGVNVRLWENHEIVLNQWIEFEFEELSEDGVPTKGVGIRIRNLNKYNQPTD